ncbi:MAG: minor capsid protein [Bacillota bacterium]|nr:minor capsid protein [Bacillota bacterium]
MAGKVTVTFNKKAVAARLKAAGEKATLIMANEFLKDANSYARHYSGELIDSSIRASDPEKGLLVWDTPYARRVYYTGRPSTDKNKQARLMWAHHAYKLNRAKYMRMAQKVVQEEV